MKQKRNYGIDLLRIIATVMVIVLHVLGVGGIVHTVDATSPTYVPAWLLEFMAYCAVNCYALISGYVGVKSKFRLSGILALWMQVVFWSVFISGLFMAIDKHFDISTLAKSFRPVISRYYWYFTAYFCLYFLMPFLNRMILSLNKKTAAYLLLVLCVLFSILPTLVKTDLFLVNSGYSAMWLIIMYVIGGIFREYYADVSFKKWVLFAGYLLSVGITLVSKLFLEFLATRISYTFYDSNFLMNYNSPTILIAGCCLVLLFSQVECSKLTRPISWLAPITFGVYIIHTHPFVFNRVFANRFGPFINLHPVRMVLAVLVTAIVAFAICAALDFLRIKLFQLLNVRKLCELTEEKIRSILNHVI